MTNHQQAAIEAAAKAMADDWNPDRDPILTAMFRDYSVSAIAAAEPHLRRKWADEARKLLNMRADFQGPHATARNRGIHDVISLLEGAGE